MGASRHYHPKRPGSATGASVVGIVTGSLGIPATILHFIYTAAYQYNSSRYGEYMYEPALVTIQYAYAMLGLATAIVLLVGGITLLRGNGYLMLSTGAFALVALIIGDTVASIIIAPPAGMIAMALLPGFGLAFATRDLTGPDGR